MSGDSRFKERAQANEELLKTDMSVRWPEAVNAAEYLYDSLVFQSENAATYLQHFIRKFYGLYAATNHHLDDEDQKIAKEGGQLRGEKVPSVEEYLADPVEYGVNRDGQEVIDVMRTGRRGLGLFQVYAELLRKSGVLKLVKTEYEEPSFGYDMDGERSDEADS